MRERALMLDNGRKFYSKEWILNLIDYLNKLEFNTLQLHFSENEGFRIESEIYPQIMSEQYLTKKEVREIIAYANERGIQIIPEFDTPGHLKQILNHFPHFQLEAEVDGKRVKNPKALNIVDKEARAFIKEIYAEYADLFKDSKYFHIGADEFIEFDKVEVYPDLVDYAKKHYGADATGIETYIEYTNEIIDYVCGLGFIPRVWNDGYYRTNRNPSIELDKRAEVTYWTRWDKFMADVVTHIDKGHQVINVNDNYFYYVLGENASYTYPTAEKINAEWHVEKFASHQVMTKEQMKSVEGVMFAIWSDIPDAQTEDEVFAGIKEPLRAMADKIKAYDLKVLR